MCFSEKREKKRKLVSRVFGLSASEEQTYPVHHSNNGPKAHLRSPPRPAAASPQQRRLAHEPVTARSASSAAGGSVTYVVSRWTCTARGSP